MSHRDFLETWFFLSMVRSLFDKPFIMTYPLVNQWDQHPSMEKIKEVVMVPMVLPKFVGEVGD